MTHIDSITFQLEDVEFEDDLYTAAYAYEESIFATFHILIDGEGLVHKNYIPARMDIVDTARAQYEALQTVDHERSFDGYPFCCTCGTRGCTCLYWSVEPADEQSAHGNETDIVIEMSDCGGEEIGAGRYRLSADKIQTAVVELIERLLAIMDDYDIDTLPWGDRKDPPVAGREFWASRAEFERYLDQIESFELAT